MRSLLRWLVRLVCAALMLIALLVIVLWWSNRDISRADLEQQYEGNDLQRLTVDGVNLAYRVSGEGPPLVLIHSHFYTMRQWQQWVDILQQDYTVIRFDLTSHGLTGVDPSGDYSHTRGVVLLRALLDHLQIERAAIAGSSTGGALARYFAASDPERVSALVLINAPGMPRVSNKYMEAGMPDWALYAFYLMPESLFKSFEDFTAMLDETLTDDIAYEGHRMYRGEGNRAAEFERMRAWQPEDIQEQLAQISAPVLVIWGEDNPQLPVEHVWQYKEQLTQAPSFEAHIYPGVGHVIPLEIPRQSALDTAAFLKSLP